MKGIFDLKQSFHLLTFTYLLYAWFRTTCRTWFSPSTLWVPRTESSHQSGWKCTSNWATLPTVCRGHSVHVSGTCWLGPFSLFTVSSWTQKSEAGPCSFSSSLSPSPTAAWLPGLWLGNPSHPASSVKPLVRPLHSWRFPLQKTLSSVNQHPQELDLYVVTRRFVVQSPLDKFSRNS